MTPNVVRILQTGGSSPAMRFGFGWRAVKVGFYGGVDVYTDPSCVWFADPDGAFLKEPVPCLDVLLVCKPIGNSNELNVKPYAYTHPDTFRSLDKDELIAALTEALKRCMDE